MPTGHIIRVELTDRSYPVVVSEGDRFAWIEPLGELAAGERVVVITDETVDRLYRSDFKRALSAAGALLCGWLAVPSGEESKSRRTLWQLYDDLLRLRLGRDGIICALGGGVVGDLAGFAAATLYRGVSYIQVPTTLIAMVDSAIGGKTGINHSLGKNLIGAFHQPMAVLTNLRTLETLPSVEFRSGLAEIIKVGVILQKTLFETLQRAGSSLLSAQTGQLLDIIINSARIKTEIVCRDEREENVRMMLNYGHTIGHAIEQTAGFGAWAHGDAVAAGMIMEAELGVELGLTPAEVIPAIADLCGVLGLPIEIGADHRRSLIGAIAQDKKLRGEKIQWAVPIEIGQGILHPLSMEQLEVWLSSATR